MPRMTPEEEELYKYQFRVAPYDTPEGRTNAPQWLLERLPQPGQSPAPPPRKFPTTPEVRRRILGAIAAKNPKYARPFEEQGRVASVSIAGTESWADYGDVVLQMAILDTLLSIEEKLGALTSSKADLAVSD